MKKKLLLPILFICFLITPIRQASAEWINLFKGILEVDIRTVEADPRNADILFAASEKNLYQSLDRGQNWKKIYSARGSNAIRIIFVDPAETKNIYVGTHSGVYRSMDGGRHWQGKLKANLSENASVFCIEPDSGNSESLWIGSETGLYSFDKEKAIFKRVDGFPQIPVYSVLDKGDETKDILISSRDGLYKSRDRGEHWQKVSAGLPAGEVEEASSLAQFDIEELAVTPVPDNLIYVPQRHLFYAATSRGIYKNSINADDWAALESANFPDKSVRAIAASDSTFYIGTDKGIYRWDLDRNLFEAIGDGLPSKEIQDIYYDQNEGFMLAATKNGLYKYSYPEITFTIQPSPKEVQAKSHEILSLFKNEPSIAEVQKAAIEYAEVHPRKIEQWRAAASKKALFPNVSVNRSMSSDENLDLDRGGTADPDHYIQGPDTKDQDWSVGVSWDLGDLIWNNDQTSIDTRSRLMVQLRDDVLTEVTHLYYERRRLQIENMLNPPKELPTVLDKEIKLEELTAGLDALTGGFFSKHLR